ncbi:MAG TPA: alpha-L-fucosidase [Rhizomicrobium sp.]|nr:alpha-L-fucosidase [Rhizomicrobium sp.]
MFSKRMLLKGAAGLAASAGFPLARAAAADSLAPGPFKPEWSSLTSQYQAPDWFRDAKFGIWAHWSAQCVPEAGDWYARNMYLQGQKQYDHHLKNYGHPADTGFMEMNNRWKAENWKPGELLDLYQKAGARYFVSLANHHDNFDNFNSRFHDWNSTRVGPKRDIVGTWARAARERGLKFGVSNHSAHAWHWFQVAYGYDPEGARAGERYDAWKLTKYDGKGKWWEGLDPQELYAGAVMPMPDGIASIKDADAWHAAHDRIWDEAPPLANPAFVRQWYLRCKDLIDSYKPDLLYFDNTGLPLGQAGLDMAAHFYNSSIAWHGSQQAVLNCKLLPDDRRAAVVEDVERGFRSEVVPHPWQTDTCIGDWHYNRERFLQKSYMPADAVVHRLCDVVAKNGCLLLSIPVRGDGTIDEEERKIVEGIAGWTGRYGEAIFASRPWRLSGEGPTQVASGQFGEGKLKPFEAADIRFTTKGSTLYAMTLGAPKAQVHIRSLAQRGTVRRVEILGAPGPLAFQQDGDGLHVTVPDGASHPYGVALKIDGEDIV